MPKGYPGINPRSPHTIFYLEGPKRGQLRICRLCPTVVFANREKLLLCAAHYKVWARERCAAKRLNKAARLAAAITALSFPQPGTTPISYTEPNGRFRARQWRRSMVAAQLHWRDLLLNHPHLLPAGLSLANLPPGTQLR